MIYYDVKNLYFNIKNKLNWTSPFEACKYAAGIAFPKGLK